MTTHEIDLVISTISENAVSGCPLEISSKATKIVKANKLGMCLGHSDIVKPKIRRKSTMRLMDMASAVIRQDVPVDVLRASLATWDFQIQHQKWIERSTVPLDYELPIAPYRFRAFSYPERNANRNSVEPRIIDPSHILTNLRIHATQKGFFGCNPQAFVRVSEKNNDVLNLSLLEKPLIDKQSVPFARRIFSRDVENLMRTNGDLREAEQTMNIRNWYDACNERALSVSTRLSHLVNMHHYLLSQYDCYSFPMTSSHVNGLPSLTFQGLIQNVSTRIQLYQLSANKTYNQRAVSTLAVENLFSTLSSLADSTSGIPLAANIPRYVSRMTQLNSIKQNPTK